MSDALLAVLEQQPDLSKAKQFGRSKTTFLYKAKQSQENSSRKQ